MAHALDDAPAYIREMPAVMQGSACTTWWEDLTRRPDAAELPDSIRRATGKTVDLVRVLGSCDHDGTTWWAFARHNKDRIMVEDLIEDWPGEQPLRTGPAVGEAPVLDNPAQLVRKALNVVPEDDDVLLTVWLVNANGHGLNVGFHAGELIEILDNTEFTDGDYIEIDEFAPFTVRVAPLPNVSHELIEERIRPILASAVKAARQLAGSGLVEMAFEPIRKEPHEGG